LELERHLRNLLLQIEEQLRKQVGFLRGLGQSMRVFYCLFGGMGLFKIYCKKWKFQNYYEKLQNFRIIMKNCKFKKVFDNFLKFLLHQKLHFFNIKFIIF
jgi:hypothetical protein